MPKQTKTKTEAKPQRVRLTVQLSWPAYRAVRQLQQQHRALTGDAVPMWRFIDAAVIAYARQQGIQNET